MSNLSVAAWRSWANAPTEPDNAAVQAAINGAEEAINDHCARQFVLAHATNTSTRLFVPDGTGVLRIDDCAEVTAVSDNGTSVAASAYQLEPINGRNLSGLTVPYEQIRKLSGVGWTCDYGKATASVTGRWGWTALPDQYLEAVKVLTKDILDMRDLRGGVVGFGDFGAVRIRENAMVSMLLSRLRRVESWGIA